MCCFLPEPWWTESGEQPSSQIKSIPPPRVLDLRLLKRPTHLPCQQVCSVHCIYIVTKQTWDFFLILEILLQPYIPLVWTHSSAPFSSNNKWNFDLVSVFMPVLFSLVITSYFLLFFLEVVVFVNGLSLVKVFWRVNGRYASEDKPVEKLKLPSFLGDEKTVLFIKLILNISKC